MYVQRPHSESKGMHCICQSAPNTFSFVYGIHGHYRILQVICGNAKPQLFSIICGLLLQLLHDWLPSQLWYDYTYDIQPSTLHIFVPSDRIFHGACYWWIFCRVLNWKYKFWHILHFNLSLGNKEAYVSVFKSAYQQIKY